MVRRHRDGAQQIPPLARGPGGQVDGVKAPRAGGRLFRSI